MDALLDDLQEQEEKVRTTKQLVNDLLRRMGEKPQFTDIDDKPGSSRKPRIEPGQFHAKPTATAVREYLEMRPERGGCPSPCEI